MIQVMKETTSTYWVQVSRYSFGTFRFTLKNLGVHVSKTRLCKKLEYDPDDVWLLLATYSELNSLLSEYRR